MKLVFTCGGTAGHINPAIAVADMMKSRHPDCEILFIGATGHMEETLVPKAGYALKCLPASGLSRRKNLAAVKQNVKAVHMALSAVGQCRRILKDFGADMVIGTGGYASFPALRAGHALGLPTLVHESNALPGVTTKLAARTATRVLVAFAESVPHYKNPSKVEVVGMPVKQDFIYLNRSDARKRLGIREDEKVVLSAFGSLGAKRMNETMAELFRMEKEEGFPFRHIHATGKFGWEWMPKLVAEKGIDFHTDKAITMEQYFYNMPELMAAADVMISRSGAATCNEIGASGIPAVLIPSPNVTANHQEKNARVLSDKDAAVTIVESECTPEKLYGEIKALLGDDSRRARMRKTLHGLVRLDSAERICDIIEQLI